jgi:hypothetical protein
VSDRPGTWREADGEAVDWDEARQAWADAAIPFLEEAGRTFGAVVRYKELGEAVQSATGIRTRKLLTHWIGDLLRAVTDRPEAAGAPLLSSLVVNAQGHVGPGYAAAVAAREGNEPDDPDVHAAGERLRCYEHLGAAVPTGSRPRLPPDLARRRKVDEEKLRKAEPRPKCPQCGGWKGTAAELCDDCLHG